MRLRFRRFLFGMPRWRGCARVRIRQPARRSGGIRVRRTAADVTTKRTRHESQSLRESYKLEPDRITITTAPESKTSGGFASRGSAMLSSPRVLPTEASERRLHALG